MALPRPQLRVQQQQQQLDIYGGSGRTVLNAAGGGKGPVPLLRNSAGEGMPMPMSAATLLLNSATTVRLPGQQH